MSRYKLTVEYDGTRYSGWQMQRGGKTIQGELIDACRELFGTEMADLYGAGRTDAGVHALGQVAHLDAETELSPLRIKYGINDRLPQDISVIDVAEVNQKFHARFDAKARSYIYQICRRRTAFGKKYVWWIRDQLDIEKMSLAAKSFEGFRDYRSFTDEEGEQSSTRMEVLHCSVAEYGETIVFHVIGTHFLWKQVRRMAGVLVESGRGKLSASEIASFFSIKSDVPAKLTAPPSGLFLERIYYRDEELRYSPEPFLNIRQ